MTSSAKELPVPARAEVPEWDAAASTAALNGTPVVLAAFADGDVYRSPDGFNLGGGGQSARVYGGPLKVLQLVGVASGVDALFDDGSVYFSSDGTDLHGESTSVKVPLGSSPAIRLVSVAGGVDAILEDGSVRISSDGIHFRPATGRTPPDNPTDKVIQIVPWGQQGAVTLLADGRAYFSPDNQYLLGGGNTQPASDAAAGSIVRLVPVGGGMLAEVALPGAAAGGATTENKVFLSVDALNLTGGGATIPIADWQAVSPAGPFGVRDSARGVSFAGKLLLSGGYRGPTSDPGCGILCSYFDLWTSVDLTGAQWNSAATFSTSTTPNPRDVDLNPPSDFFDAYSPLIPWNGRLLALGHTVWSSADGMGWTRVDNPDGTPAIGPAPFRAGENSRAVTLGGSLFYIEPETGSVARSTDASGSAWLELGPIPGFAGRCGAAVFVAANRIWIEGGGSCDYSEIYADQWYSGDGVNWVRNAEVSALPNRLWPCVVADSAGLTWLFGGYAPSDWNRATYTQPRYAADLADVWYTRNGSDWRQLKAGSGSGLPDSTAIEPRHAPTCYIDETGTTKKLVVIAGKGSSRPDDRYASPTNSIWALPLPAATTLP